MEPERHLLALRHEAAALADAARAGGLDARVPSCPDWDVAALLAHASHGYRWVTRIVTTHADAEVFHADVPDAAPDDPVAAFEESLAELVEALTNEPPDAPCWNWSGQDLTVAFWCRRMAHETAVHRWDAELARGTARPVEPELAADGVDESLGVFLPNHLGETPVDGLSGTFQVVAADTGDAWHGTLWPDRSETARGGLPAAAATLRGTASDLLLRLWGRDVRIDATGDERIVGLLTE